MDYSSWNKEAMIDGDCPAEWKLETSLQSQALEEESYQQLQNLPLHVTCALMLSADKILRNVYNFKSFHCLSNSNWKQKNPRW